MIDVIVKVSFAGVKHSYQASKEPVSMPDEIAKDAIKAGFAVQVSPKPSRKATKKATSSK